MSLSVDILTSKDMVSSCSGWVGGGSPTMVLRLDLHSQNIKFLQFGQSSPVLRTTNF